MFDLSPERLRFMLLAVIVMILSAAVHEWAHAFTAVKLGDDTPIRQGRLTLNPMVHIDPIGTIVMPAIGAMFGFLFGYAKPVEFSPVKLTRKLTMRTGVLLVAVAGPLSNLVLAFLCGGILRIISAVAGPEFFDGSTLGAMVAALLFAAIWLNVVLFLFNLLPIYPLDGSKILEGVLPRRHHHILEVMQRNSLLIMALILLVGIRFLSVPILGLIGVVIDVYGLDAHQLWTSLYA